MAKLEVDKDEVYLNVMKALKQMDAGHGATQVEIRKYLIENGMNPDPEMNEVGLGTYVREALKRAIQFRVLYRTNSDGKYHITDNPPCPPPVLEDDDEGPPRPKRLCPPPKPTPKSASTPTPNPTNSSSTMLVSSTFCRTVNGAIVKQEMTKQTWKNGKITGCEYVKEEKK